MSARPGNPDATLIPLLIVEESSEVFCAYYDDADAALNAAFACERLGFGWRLDAYDTPISDTEMQREWRVVAWKFVRSDALLGLRRVPEGNRDE